MLNTRMMRQMMFLQTPPGVTVTQSVTFPLETLEPLSYRRFDKKNIDIDKPEYVPQCQIHSGLVLGPEKKD